jgi:hypothetical protein
MSHSSEAKEERLAARAELGLLHGHRAFLGQPESPVQDEECRRRWLTLPRPQRYRGWVSSTTAHARSFRLVMALRAAGSGGLTPSSRDGADSRPRLVPNSMQEGDAHRTHCPGFGPR